MLKGGDEVVARGQVSLLDLWDKEAFQDRIALDGLEGRIEVAMEVSKPYNSRLTVVLLFLLIIPVLIPIQVPVLVPISTLFPM